MTSRSRVQPPGFAAELTRVAESDASAAWARLQRLGTPVLEEVGGHPDRLLASFGWRPQDQDLRPDQVLAVTLVSPALPGQAPGQLRRVGAGDLWLGSFELLRGARGSYWFRIDLDGGDHLAQVPDRLGGDMVEMVWPERGQVQLSILDSSPRTPPGERFWETPAGQPGQLEPFRHKSRILDSEREIWVYSPAASAGRPGDLLVVFDGDAYLLGMSVPAILENLIAAGHLPPVTAALVASPPAERLLDLWTNPRFARMLVEELEPRLRSDFALTASPATAAGASAGGLCAAFLALAHPDRFGRAVSLSGAFWRPSHRAEGELAEFEETEEWGWLAHEFASRPRQDVRIHLSVGSNETRTARGRHRPPILWANRNLRDVLLAREYRFTYREYPGGHDPICWREELARGLMAVYS